MPYATYNRPISKVGFRVMNQTNPQAAAALGGRYPFTYGGLGQTASASDQATLTSIYGSTTANQIVGAYQSGVLSADGYQQLVSGTVDPSEVGDFINADLGAATTPSWLQWLEQPSFGGIPNWIFLTGIAFVFAELINRQARR
jgi:hypothetical protein